MSQFSINPANPNTAGAASFNLGRSGYAVSSGSEAKTAEQIAQDKQAARDQMFGLLVCDEGYEFFGTTRLRDELCDFSAGAADYIHDKGIEAVSYMDRSARLARVGIEEVLKLKYEDTALPAAFFVNPRGFRPTGTNTLDENIKLKGAQFHGDLVDSPDNRRSKEAIRQEFKNSFAGLLAYTDDPVLLFDTCAHSGNQARFVLETLDETGFTDVHFAVASVALREPPKCREPNLIMTAKQPAASCWPFGKHATTYKTYGSTIPTRREAIPGNAAQNGRLRAEIKRIILEQLG